jgi:hypothetical protein
MGATVIVVDTNQIRDSPMLRNRDWIANHYRRWLIAA